MRYAAKWPEYARQWDAMRIKPPRQLEMRAYAAFAAAHRTEYAEVEQATGVPWWLVAVLHRRESNADFNSYLGNGEPLGRKTKLVPKGRGPFATFLDGAVDALRIDGLSSVQDWRLEKALYYCELFNGAGYDMRGLPSPYIWGGTNIQRAGKYVADRKWSSTKWDVQPGCAPILWLIAEDQGIVFTRET